MKTESALKRTLSSISPDDIDERRRAPWLLNNYSADVWIVSDTRDHNQTARINFLYRLADGRLLPEWARFYATVKEYAWWLRDARYSRIDDAFAHAVLVRNMMHLAHALSIRKLQSFAQIQPLDIEELIEECRFGLEGVVRASSRVDLYINFLSIENTITPTRYGGLPHYVSPAGAKSNTVNVTQLLKNCNLPASCCYLPRVAALIAQAAVANGMRGNFDTSAGIPPLQIQTTPSLQRWLDPLEQLYEMRGRVEAEFIEFKPFTLGAARVAAVKGVDTSRTPTVPPRLVLHLLEHAVRSIFEEGPALKANLTDRVAIIRMATACWIVIAAFTARRDQEINDLRVDCLRGDNDSGWWLNVYIEKTLQRKEWIPVPNMVARAVEILAAISETARLDTDTDYLFQWSNPKRERVRLDLGRRLDEFAAFVNVPMHAPRGKEPIAWHWHPHQFRRFFAILYFYRFEDGSIEAISHHLRHLNLEMTRGYLTEDPDVAALWTNTEWGYMGHFARSIVAGERVVSGPAGERLKKTAKRLYDIFRRKLQVVTPERLGSSLTVIMQRQGMVLTPKPWVTCSCPRTVEAAAKAACRRESPEDQGAVGPNFAQAGPSVCASCPHAITEASRQPFIDAELNHLETAIVSKSRAGTMFGMLEDARVVELREVRNMAYAVAKPLNGISFDLDEAE